MQYELFFYQGLESNPLALVLIIFMAGIWISYSINYFIGSRLTELAKKVIKLKRFYKIKAFVNRHGVVAVYILNVLPVVSQPTSMLLGVFKYNKLRFYIFMSLGQMTKYMLIYGAFVII